MIELEKTSGQDDIKLEDELANFKWLTLDEAGEMNEKDLLIGKDSPTGTFGQLSQVKK